MQLKRGLNKLFDRKHFTYQKYEEFLASISRHRILPLNEFRNYHNDKEVVIGLRHDSDSNFEALERMAWIENKHWIRSTYFVLHSAHYFTPEIYPSLLKMQSLGFEIGLHNDAMSFSGALYTLYDVIKKLRNAGLKIYGTSAHGDKAHRNITFWEKFDKEQVGIDYEAYELDHNKYYSDCTFINGHRWHPGMLPEFKRGDRVQILIHPEIWGNKLYL